MFGKFKRAMKLNQQDKPTDEEWSEGLERQGGLEKNDFLAMVLSAMIVILPICLLLLLFLVLVCGLFLLF